MPNKPPNARARQAAADAKRVSVRVDQRRGSARKRGYTWAWDKAAAAFLAHPDNVLCRIHLRQGRAVVATLVDHIIPHRGDQQLFWRRSNWQPLCKPCHDSVKQAEEAAATLQRLRG